MFELIVVGIVSFVVGFIVSFIVFAEDPTYPYDYENDVYPNDDDQD